MAKVRYKRPKRGRPGRRVYKTRSASLRRNSDFNSAARIIFSIAGLAVLVFIGYSIGAPIHRYVTEKREEKERSAMAANDEKYASDYDERLPVVTSTFSFEEEPVTETSADIPSADFPDIPPLSEINAASVELSAMNDTELLASEMQRIKSLGCNAAVFTLKAEGGDIYFKIGSPFAAFAGGENIRSELFADELADAAKNMGLYPIAKINLLEDSFRYGDGCYGCYKDEYGNVWTDENGKSYLSPYDENTIDYISEIASEAAEGGFDYIIVSGLRFPDFTVSDYGRLGEYLAFGDRSSALVRAANTVYRSAEKYGCGVILEANASDIEKGCAEAVKPEELLFGNICVVYGENDPDVSRKVRGMNVIGAYLSDPPAGAQSRIRY